MRSFSTVALALLMACSEERTLEITRLPIACADDVRMRVTQVVVGAEGDFAPVEISQPPDTPLQLASLPQDARVLTVIGTIGGQPALIGRTGTVDLATAPASIPIAYGPPGGFCATGSMRVARTNHAAVKMQDGRVLVAGGGDPSIEIYDPRTASWGGYDTGYELDSSANPAAVTAVSLADGRVLLVGDGKAQFVDASGHLVKPSIFLGGLREAAAARLADGRIFVAGTATSAIYDPSVAAFTSGPRTQSRSGGFAFPLPDGTILLVGGGAKAEFLDLHGPGPGPTLSGTDNAAAWVQLASGTVVGFSPDGNGDVFILPEERQVFPLVSHSTTPRATVLADGNVLLSGGTPALFIPSRGDTVMASDPSNVGATVTLLDDGTLLAAGGGTSEARLYFHSTTDEFSTLPIMTFDDDELGLIPRIPGVAAQRSNGTYHLLNNFALLGGVQFTAVTVRVSFAGDLDVLVGWLSAAESFTVRFGSGTKVALLHNDNQVCTGSMSPDSGFVTVDARNGRIRAADAAGATVLDCAATLPPRFSVGVGGQNATIDDLEAIR